MVSLPHGSESFVDRGQRRLRADCARCFGLCCVAPPFAASADFAIDKAPGKPCPNLQSDFRCGIHERLRPSGFAGCTVYDCFGAGQKLAQLTFAGADWRQQPAQAERMFALLPVMRQLHEMLWYLEEALTLAPARPLHPEIERIITQTEQLTRRAADALAKLDVEGHRSVVSTILFQASRLVRAQVVGRKKERRNADLLGAKLRGANLRGANLRGACLIAADLRDADLRLADFIGADLRDTDLSGANLEGSFFLTQSQLQAAQGDAATILPASLSRPLHWPPAGKRSLRVKR